MRLLDRLLLVVCGALVLAVPIMTVQEYVEALEAPTILGPDGETIVSSPPAAPKHYTTWRFILLVLILVAGILGSVQAIRILRAPRVRPYAGRLMGLLVTGLAVLDLTFLLDGVLADKGFLARAITIAWLYPTAALVTALSAYRLAELEAAFGTRAPPTPPAGTA